VVVVTSKCLREKPFLRHALELDDIAAIVVDQHDLLLFNLTGPPLRFKSDIIASLVRVIIQTATPKALCKTRLVGSRGALR
jgi:hypothetical protein